MEERGTPVARRLGEPRAVALGSNTASRAKGGSWYVSHHSQPRRPGSHEPGEPVAERHPRQLRLAVARQREDRKSTRLNSSHANISYAVFCLKKKKKKKSY